MKLCKFVFAVLVISCALLPLAGCGGAPDNSDGGSNTTSECFFTYLAVSYC